MWPVSPSFPSHFCHCPMGPWTKWLWWQRRELCMRSTTWISTHQDWPGYSCSWVTNLPTAKINLSPQHSTIPGVISQCPAGRLTTLDHFLHGKGNTLQTRAQRMGIFIKCIVCSNPNTSLPLSRMQAVEAPLTLYLATSKWGSPVTHFVLPAFLHFFH